MVKHNPWSIWMLRKPGQYPNGEVNTTKDGNIMIGYIYAEGAGMNWQEISRLDARLLAKRLNQCLDATK